MSSSGQLYFILGNINCLIFFCLKHNKLYRSTANVWRHLLYENIETTVQEKAFIFAPMHLNYMQQCGARTPL